MKIGKKIVGILMLLTAGIMLFTACDGNPEPKVPEEPKNPDNGSTQKPPPPPIPDLPFLRVEGELVLNDFNEQILLQGINIGGYLVTERWMCLIAAGGTVDHRPMTDVFTERFGKEKTLEIWENYRKHFFTEEDFKNCADMGMNVLRLPFTYMTVDPVYNNVREITGQKYNFSILDDFIEMAKDYGMYTILDMHGAYGSQNGQDHSGQSIAVPGGDSATMETIQQYVTFWTNHPDGIENRRKTTELWVALAERYRDNPNVAGYDLLNEPAEKGRQTQKRHWDYFDELYKAIRAVDPDTIIIIESCWEGGNLPHPVNSTHGYKWDHNVMYSFHHYTHYDGGNNYANHMSSMRRRLDEVRNRNFGVPLYMGEFTVLNGGEQGWVDTLALFQERGWHWTNWTYKVRSARSVWGVYNTNLANNVEEGIYNLIRADTDTFEDIMRKWSRVGTTDSSVGKFTFDSGNTLFDVIRDACTRNL